MAIEKEKKSEKEYYTKKEKFLFQNKSI
jgi:hypothetical protein